MPLAYGATKTCNCGDCKDNIGIFSFLQELHNRAATSTIWPLQPLCENATTGFRVAPRGRYAIPLLTKENTHLSWIGYCYVLVGWIYNDIN